MIVKIIKIEIIVGKVWLAPNPRPPAIDKNKYANSSGSLIGVLNLTIDKAPTKPSDSASEDFTIAITRVVVSKMNGKTLLNSFLLLKVDPYFI